MKALISGPHSFLASHVTTALQDRGVEVVPIHRSVFQNFRLLKALMQEEQPDYIINAAAFGNHGMQKDHQLIIEANLIGCYNMLQASLDVPYRVFIQIGTSSEYGHKDKPMKETDSLDGDTFYAATKIAATKLCEAYRKTFNKPIVVVRPFSVFGEREADWRFIPTVIRSLVNDEVMSFNPTPQHDWVHVSDFVSGVLACIDNVDNLWITNQNVVNIGTGKMWTNEDVLLRLELIAERQVRFVDNYVEPPHHSAVWVADNTRLKALGWKQNKTLEQGLREAYEYYKEKYVKEE